MSMQALIAKVSERNVKTEAYLLMSVSIKNKEHDDDDFVDELLYSERYSIERTNAWLDSFRSILIRHDTTLTSWKAWNYIAFAILLLRKC